MKIAYKINGQTVTAQQFASAGDPKRFDEMIASGRVPGCLTDREFLQGHCNGSQFEDTPSVGDFYKNEAKEAGVDCKGKVYLSGLAAFPGDPKAWVSGRGDAQRVLEERGWASEGAVKVKMGDVAQPTGGGVAPELIAEEAQAVAVETGTTIEDATEKVHNLRKPHWVK